MSTASEHNVKAGFAICFLALLTLLGTSAVVVCLEKHLVHARPARCIVPDVPPVSSFKAKYPFDGVEPNKKNSSPGSQRKTSFVSKCLGRIAGCKYVLEQYTTRKNLVFPYCCRLITAIDEWMGNDVIENGHESIVRLPRGYFSYVYSYKDESRSWNVLQEFKSWLKERDIPLLQLLPATKSDDSITVFPPGVPHGYSRMIEDFKKFLAANDIPVLDATQVLLAENGDFYSWFYKTDHHWNVLAGRLIAEATARRLNEDFKILADVPAVHESNFALVQYPTLFRGSMAVKCCTVPEDFQVYYLLQESVFHVEVPDLGIDRTGGFNDTLIVQSYLKAAPYCAFLYGDRPLIRIENINCVNSSRVLVIKHSQADVLCPYLACTVRHLDIIDPRHFDGNIKAFIEETKPLIVILCI